jgi:hypothetical protein
VPRLAQLRSQAQQRGLEGAQDALEQVALPAWVELAQALQGLLVEHRGRGGIHGVRFSKDGGLLRLPERSRDERARAAIAASVIFGPKREDLNDDRRTGRQRPSYNRGR